MYVALLIISSDRHKIIIKKDFQNLYKGNKTWSWKDKMKKGINSTQGVWPFTTKTLPFKA